jgi:predicted RNase H-like HicB family nuclease
MKYSIQDILNKPYARILIRDNDGTYTAEILEFPGCFAEGDTPDEAISDLDKAAASWIEAASEQNEDIPEPLANYGYSGKINLRLPKSIHKQAARFAQKDDISLNQFFMSAIAARVGAEEFCEHLIEKLKNWFIPTAYTITLQQLCIYGDWQTSNKYFNNCVPEELPVSFIPEAIQKIVSQDTREVINA